MALLDLDLHPDARKLRRFGMASGVVFGGLALAGHLAWAWPPALALGVGALGLGSGVLALLRPGANRPLYLLLSVGLHPVGILVSLLMLALLFYGVLTPVSLVFRLMGRDALRRRRDPGARSYWISRPPAPDVGRYFRPF